MARNPVLLIMSLLAGANAILAAGSLQDLLSPTTFAWVVLGVAGIQAAAQFWVRGEVTPLIDPRDRAGARLRPIRSHADTDEEKPPILGI